MKIKSDFITNSSSSSFVVLGTTININDLIEDYLEKTVKAHNRKDLGIDGNDDINAIKAEFDEYVDIFIKGTDLTYSRGSGYDDDDEFMVGICYTKMKDDETLADFKTRVRKEIFMAFKIGVTPHHIEECWEDR